MKKLIIILTFIAIFFISGCQNQEDKIKSEIEKAGYCDIDSDCILITSRCPFDCYAAINVKEKERITNLIEAYNPRFSKCVYGCVECKSSICKNNKCENVCNN